MLQIPNFCSENWRGQEENPHLRIFGNFFLLFDEFPLSPHILLKPFGGPKNAPAPIDLFTGTIFSKGKKKSSDFFFVKIVRVLLKKYTGFYGIHFRFDVFWYSYKEN